MVLGLAVLAMLGEEDLEAVAFPLPIVGLAIDLDALDSGQIKGPADVRRPSYRPNQTEDEANSNGADAPLPERLRHRVTFPNV